MTTRSQIFHRDGSLPSVGPINHGITDVLFIAADFGWDHDLHLNIIKTAEQLGMCALHLDDNDYVSSNISVYWLVGDVQAVGMFSLKFKETIQVQMDQAGMNDAMEMVDAWAFDGKQYDQLDLLFKVLAPGLSGSLFTWATKE